MSRDSKAIPIVIWSAVFFCTVAVSSAENPAAALGWPTYGGDPGGQRYSNAKQVNRSNVTQLRKSWEYRTHALDLHATGSYSAAFETTPVLFDNVLYLTSPLDDVIALDPATGTERWRYRPATNGLREGDITTSRGVATWDGGNANPCGTRIFFGTNDAHLVALDARSGTPCEGFSTRGSIDLRAGLEGPAREFHITSAPTVLGDTVVIGSSIPDNLAANMPSGIVRAFDVRTGKQKWAWDPIPWSHSPNFNTGAANTWSTIAADKRLGLLYLPTGSASPDYYGGMRLGSGRDADSIVAIEAATGREVWSFQLVHHDLWDYDVASEPLLFMWHGSIPAVAVVTKMGSVFVLDRRSGVPLYNVEEHRVPSSDIEGEQAWPTQPFSGIPSLTPSSVLLDGVSPSRSDEDRELCRKQLSALRYDGLFTPPSLKGSLVFPGAIGGVNWGSVAYDPTTGLLYANTNRLAYYVQLISKKIPFYIGAAAVFISTPSLVFLAWWGITSGIFLWERRRSRKNTRFLIFTTYLCCGMFVLSLAGRLYVNTRIKQSKVRSALNAVEAREFAMRGAFGDDQSLQTLAPYSLHRHPIVDSHGEPCSPEPWGTVAALNLQTGKMAWEVPHGTQIPGRRTGALSLGGVAVTAGGLVFSAGTREPLLRAYDSETGQELWSGQLPVPAQATPMTYEIQGKQFVVIAAGGHGLWGTRQGDSVIAFSVP